MIRWCLSLLLFFCCGAYAVSSAAKATPSFDCAKAKNEAERLICADEDLAKLDVEMNKSYHAFMKTLDESYYRNKLKRKQIDWLGYREKLSCFNTDDVKKVTCLKNAYQRRIENLNAWAARQNYDFFIDYPDYYEQSKRVGAESGLVQGLRNMCGVLPEGSVGTPGRKGSTGGKCTVCALRAV